MGFIAKTKSLAGKGFSVVEIMIVLPIASLLVLVLIAAFFTQYMDSLAESTRTNLHAEGQTILINLQDELLFTISYGEGLESRLSDPNEPSGGWTHSTDPQTLLINEVALDSNRRDETRNIVRQALVNCETSSITTNPLAINSVIYFVEDVSGSQYDRLVKRTIIPTYSLCSIDTDTGNPCTPTTSTCRGLAKETTCPEGLIGTNNCTSKDSVLSENVLDFEIEYFEEDNLTATSPSDADKIQVKLTLGDKVYGREIVTEVNHTIRKIN